MIPRQLETFRTARNKTRELVADLTQEQMDFRSASGQWSVGEVLDHLILSDRLYRREIGELIELQKAGKRPYLRRSFADFNPSIFFIPQPLLPLLEIPFTLTNMFVPASIRSCLARSRWVPAQNPTGTAPRPGRPADDLRRDLGESFAGIAAMFDDNPDIDYEKLIHDHPLLGRNTIPQLLEVFISHEGRHREQIRDIVASARFPKAA